MFVYQKRDSRRIGHALIAVKINAVYRVHTHNGTQASITEKESNCQFVRMATRGGQVLAVLSPMETRWWCMRLPGKREMAGSAPNADRECTDCVLRTEIEMNV